MSFLLAVLVVVGFAATIGRLDLASRTREVSRRARDCFEVLRDPSLDDDAKERRLRGHSVRLFGLLGILGGGSLLGLGVPLFGVWLLDRAGFASLDGVLAVLGRVDFLAGTAVLGLLAYVVVRRGGA